MSDTGPRLPVLGIWEKRERMCLAILELALRLLQMKEALPESEVDLNRDLYRLLPPRRVCGRIRCVPCLIQTSVA
jgi:hypothetical protein